MSSKIKIGRDESNDIVIDAQYPTVSRCHAYIYYKDNVLVFRDMSANGSYVNEKWVNNSEIEIHTEDRITLGKDYHIDWEQINRHMHLIAMPNNSNVVTDNDIATIPKNAKGLLITHYPKNRLLPNIQLAYFADKSIWENIPWMNIEGESKIIFGENQLEEAIDRFNKFKLKKRIKCDYIPANHVFNAHNTDLVVITAYDSYGKYFLNYWTFQEDGSDAGNLNISGNDLHQLLCNEYQTYRKLSSWIFGFTGYIILLLIIAGLIYFLYSM